MQQPSVCRKRASGAIATTCGVPARTPISRKCALPPPSNCQDGKVPSCPGPLSCLRFSASPPPPAVPSNPPITKMWTSGSIRSSTARSTPARPMTPWSWSIAKSASLPRRFARALSSPPTSCSPPGTACPRPSNTSPVRTTSWESSALRNCTSSRGTIRSRERPRPSDRASRCTTTEARAFAGATSHSSVCRATSTP